MLIDLLENSDLIRGYSELSVTPEGWYPSRFQEDNAWAGLEGFMPSCTAGVRLCFRTDAKTLRLSMILGENAFEFCRGDVDVFAGQKCIFSAKPTEPGPADQPFEIQVKLPEGQPELTVYLPTYQRTVVVRLELVGATQVWPVNECAGRMLFIGDSITQGYGATPGFCYAAQMARELNCDYLNLGIGGACMPETLPEHLELTPFSHVVLAFGTNDANNFRRGADIKRCLTRLLDQVCGDGRLVMVSSPVAWPAGIRRNKVEAWHEVEAAIREVGMNYPGIRYVDGSGVLPWDDSYFVDGIHPNRVGMSKLAQAFLEKANGASYEVHGS